MISASLWVAIHCLYLLSAKNSSNCQYERQILFPMRVLACNCPVWHPLSNYSFTHLLNMRVKYQFSRNQYQTGYAYYTWIDYNYFVSFIKITTLNIAAINSNTFLVILCQVPFCNEKINRGILPCIQHTANIFKLCRRFCYSFLKPRIHNGNIITNSRVDRC